MQNNFFKNFLQILFRGVLIGVVALAVFLGGVYMVSAQTAGGKFWEILNKILGGDWQNSDGTVQNAKKFDWRPASAYQQIPEGEQRCLDNQCMVGMKENGDIICR